MAKTIRIDDDVYNDLQTEARVQNTSIAQLASMRFKTNKQGEKSDAVLSGASTEGQPLEITLVDRRQDARIDSLEEHVKQLSAGVISNRVGILHLADDKADEVDSVMTGAYNKLLELGFTDIAKEVKRLSTAARDSELDEDDDLEYYDEGDEDDE